jgi:membrane protein DedA with SNARE-associated domain
MAAVSAGTLFPGTVVLMAAGEAVGLGHLPFWPIMIRVILGEIAADRTSLRRGREGSGRTSGAFLGLHHAERLAQAAIRRGCAGA